MTSNTVLVSNQHWGTVLNMKSTNSCQPLSAKAGRQTMLH